jgi:glycosyltransferase involved in cell wall biosynthesis
MRNAKGFIFAAEEDFGITMVEALAAGTPVLVYNVGGASEIVRNGVSGFLFNNQSPKAIASAVKEFETIENKFDSAGIAKYAGKFSRTNFENSIRQFVQLKYDEFYK